MRYTQRVSVWPVGLAGYLRYERPVLDTSGHVVGWFTAWKPNRRFALDMAGFAVNTRLLTSHRSAEFSYNVSRGEQESFFLSQLVGLADLEPKANNCTEVLSVVVLRVKPKFHLARHVASHFDTTRHVRRVERGETSFEPCCSTSSKQPKRMGSTRRTCRILSRSDVTRHVEFGL